MKLRLALIAAVAAAMLFPSCDDGFGNFSTNPADRLAFSTDTLRFDTLLTTVSSPVRSFRVYNRNSQPLLISSVRLEQGDDSPFKINVDGYAGHSFENIELRAGDSILVLVDVHPDDFGRTELNHITDRALFTVNGVQDGVVLEAWGQDVYRFDVLTITADTLLPADRPYLITRSLEVAEGATLTVAAGTVFYMQNGAGVVVNGCIRTEGTAENPVVFRGSRTDYLPLSKHIPYDLIPGQWEGIVFGPESFDNLIEHTHVRNCNYGLSFELSDPEQQKATLRSCRITNVSDGLLAAVNCRITAENCEFTNSADQCITVIGGACRFTHCTIANCYPTYLEAGWKYSDNLRLVLGNYIVAEDGETGEEILVVCPLTEAVFENTILVSAKAGSDLYFAPYEGYDFNYSFRNCVMSDKEFTDPGIVGCIFGATPDSLFVDCVASDADGQDFAYDFRLRAGSPAIDCADVEISARLPFDFNGRDRMADGKPDVGAYEFEK